MRPGEGSEPSKISAGLRRFKERPFGGDFGGSMLTAGAVSICFGDLRSGRVGDTEGDRWSFETGGRSPG